MSPLPKRVSEEWKGYAKGSPPEMTSSTTFDNISEALYHPELRVEVNYVLEDNVRMNNALRNLAVKPLRRYRVYQMPIAG